MKTSNVIRMEMYIMSEILRGVVVDASFDPLTRTEAECLQTAGTPLYVQCLRTDAVIPAARIPSLCNAINAGLPVAGYITLNKFHAGSFHIREGRAGVPDDIWKKLLFVAVDVELRGITIDQITDAVNEVEKLGQRAIIYTNKNSWLNYVIPSNSITLAKRGILLWNALWDLHPDIDFPRLPFGGWSPDQVIGEQWSGGTMVCKQFVDRNTFVKELLFKEEEELSSQEFENLNKRINQTLNFTSIHIVAINDKLNELVCTTRALKETFDTHFTTHNTSGGVMERNAILVLDEVEKLVKAGEELREEFLEELNTIRANIKESVDE